MTASNTANSPRDDAILQAESRFVLFTLFYDSPSTLGCSIFNDVHGVDSVYIVFAADTLKNTGKLLFQCL